MCASIYRVDIHTISEEACLHLLGENSGAISNISIGEEGLFITFEEKDDIRYNPRNMKNTMSHCFVPPTHLPTWTTFINPVTAPTKHFVRKSQGRVMKAKRKKSLLDKIISLVTVSNLQEE